MEKHGWVEPLEESRSGLSTKRSPYRDPPSFGTASLGVRIDSSGRKSFVVRYRPKGSGASGPKRFVTIGRYGVLTADEARGRAKEILGVVATGGDPAEDIAEKRAALTFKEVVDLFLKEHVSAKRKSSTAVGYSSLLATYAVPALGSRKADAVTRAEVARTVRSAKSPIKPIAYLPSLAAPILSPSDTALFLKTAIRQEGLRNSPRTVVSVS